MEASFFTYPKRNTKMTTATSPKPPERMVKVKPYLQKELAAIYEVDYRTFKKWIKPFESEIGTKIGYYFQVHQVRVIFKHLPLPHNVIVCDDYEE